MADHLNPLTIKLASIAVHALEMLDETTELGRSTDERVIRSLMADQDVIDALQSLDAAALIPVRRDGKLPWGQR